MCYLLVRVLDHLCGLALQAGDVRLHDPHRDMLATGLRELIKVPLRDLLLERIAHVQGDELLPRCTGWVLVYRPQKPP